MEGGSWVLLGSHVQAPGTLGPELLLVLVTEGRPVTGR